MTKQFGLVTKDDYNNIYCHDKPLWPFLDYYFKPISLFWIIVMTKMSLWQLRPSQGEGGGYLCPQCEFQICSFHILRSKLCPCQTLSHPHVFVALSSSHVLPFPGHVACLNFTQPGPQIPSNNPRCLSQYYCNYDTFFYYSKQISLAVLQS